MTITKQQVTDIMVQTRMNKILIDLDYDTTIEKVLPYMEDPIGFALRILEYTTASIILVTDAEIAFVESDETDEFLDLTEYRLLHSVHQNMPEVDVKIGHRQEEFSQLANRVQGMIDRKRTEIRKLYGYGLGILEAGVVDLNWVTTNDDTNVGY